MNHFLIIRQKPKYLIFASALFISGLGTAFTSVAVYSEIASRQSHPFLYTLAFILGLAPALISSQIAGKYATRFSFTKWFSAMQVMAALLLLPAILGAKSIWLLLFAETISSFVGGLLMPAYRHFEKETFKDEELPTAAVFDNFVFSLNFIFGQGLGGFLYPLIGTKLFLAFDFATYIIAGIIILFNRNEAATYVSNYGPVAFEFSKLTPIQKRALWLYPFLSFICGALMAILPYKANQYDPAEKVLFLSPVLFLISSRTLGQILGPFIVRGERFLDVLKDTRIIPICLGLFIVLYGIVVSTSFSAVD